jgi:hypothetical protein
LAINGHPRQDDQYCEGNAEGNQQQIIVNMLPGDGHKGAKHVVK